MKTTETEVQGRTIDLMAALRESLAKGPIATPPRARRHHSGMHTRRSLTDAERAAVMSAWNALDWSRRLATASRDTWTARQAGLAMRELAAVFSQRGSRPKVGKMTPGSFEARIGRIDAESAS